MVWFQLSRRWGENDLIAGHCGATDFWNDVVGATRAVPNLYLEASLARPFLFASYLEQVGEEKGIMGSAAPLNELAFEWEQMRLAVSETGRSAVLGGNLGRLLEKGGPL